VNDVNIRTVPDIWLYPFGAIYLVIIVAYYVYTFSNVLPFKKPALRTKVSVSHALLWGGFFLGAAVPSMIDLELVHLFAGVFLALAVGLFVGFATYLFLFAFQKIFL
jgi:hypothetical protein